MIRKTGQTILLVGSDETLTYLLGRFAEKSNCMLAVRPSINSVQEITEINPKAIIFLSMEYLADTHAIMAELTGLETQIIVCSAIGEESRARAFGADHCLFHPITLDGFQAAL